MIWFGKSFIKIFLIIKFKKHRHAARPGLDCLSIMIPPRQSIVELVLHPFSGLVSSAQIDNSNFPGRATARL